MRTGSRRLPSPLAGRLHRLLAALVTLVVMGTLVGPPWFQERAAHASDVLAPPPSLVADGLPPIPTALAQGIRRYTRVHSPALVDWHPERAQLMVLARAGEVRQVHLVKSPLGGLEKLTSLPDRVHGASWNPSPERPIVALTTDPGGSELYRVFVLDLRKGSLEPLTDAKSRSQGLTWSRDGRHLAWANQGRNGVDFDIYTWSVDGGPARRVHEGQGDWRPCDWSPDGRRLLMERYVSVRESTVRILDVASGKTTPLAGMDRPGERAVLAKARWSEDGQGIYFVGDRDSEFVRLWRHDLATGRNTAISAEGLQGDVTDYEVSATGVVAYDTNEDGISHLRLVRPERDRDGRTTVKTLPSPSLPDGIISQLRFHPRTGELAFHFESARTPGEILAWNPETRTVTHWTRARVPGMDADRFAAPSLIRYQSFDGRQIPAFVYRPGRRKAGGPFPVLVSIHGGPEGQRRPGFLGVANYYLDELGVALVYPNVRGSTGYGKTYVDLDNGMRREDSVKDIGALLDWIATQPDLDARRVMVEGGSYGGFMSLATMVRESARLRGGIDVVGISHFVTFLESTRGYRRDLRRAEYGDERDAKMRAYLEAVSPLSQAERIRKPLFVVQGANDPRVPRSEAEQIVARVRGQGVPVWYLLGKDEGHGFARKSNIDFYQAAKVLFMQQVLLK